MHLKPTLIDYSLRLVLDSLHYTNGIAKANQIAKNAKFSKTGIVYDEK